MKTFKQLINEVEDRSKKLGKIFRGRLSQKLEAENALRALEGIGGRQYSGIGHDVHDIATSPEKTAKIRREVFGLHPDTESKPSELWMHYADPTKMENDDRRQGSILYHPLKSHKDETIHGDVFDMDRKAGPFLSGRIDHQRKTISMSTSLPRYQYSFSSSALDRIVKQLKDRHPEYDIVDLVTPPKRDFREDTNARVKRIIAECIFRLAI